jgi:FixJ family two-component response regulator
MVDPDGMVYVVDDDPSVRSLLTRLVRSVGLTVQAFSSSQEFLESVRSEGPACLILDVRLPGLSGLDLQERLAEADPDISIIFITGFGSVPQSVRAMKAGAVDYLEKPFENQALLDAVQRALDVSRLAHLRRRELREIGDRVKSLTTREYEVLVRVAAGLANKQVADELALSEKTVKIHRANVMRKMQAQTFAELVRMVEKLKLPPVPLKEPSPRP